MFFPRGLRNRGCELSKQPSPDCDLGPQIVKLFFSLASALHLFACAFWRIKKETFSSVRGSLKFFGFVSRIIS